MSKKRFDGPAGKIVPFKKDKGDSLDQRLNTPVTVAECLQLSQAVLSDFVNSTFREELMRLTDIIVSQTVHIETIKDLLIQNGNWDESQYVEALKKHTDDYNKQRREYIEKMKEVSGNGNEDNGGDTRVSENSEETKV